MPVHTVVLNKYKLSPLLLLLVMVEGKAAGPTLQGSPPWRSSLAPLLTVPVVAYGEFLPPRAIADPVKVRPHGGREQPLQVVRVWQESSGAKWPQALVPPKLRAPYEAQSTHSPPYCPICGEDREMKESTLCSSITESSARHTRPPVGRPPHWAGI